MRIGTVIYPLLAVCLASYGGYRALVGRFRFVRLMGGRASASPMRMYMHHDCRTYHYQLYMMRDGEVRKYFDMSPIVLPSRVAPVNVGLMSLSLAEPYRGMLRGWHLTLCMSVPGYAKEFVGRDEIGSAMWRVKREFSFGSYCKECGVPYSKLRGAMDDLRGQLYKWLLEAGYVSEEDIRQ